MSLFSIDDFASSYLTSSCFQAYDVFTGSTVTGLNVSTEFTVSINPSGVVMWYVYPQAESVHRRTSQSRDGHRAGPDHRSVLWRRRARTRNDVRLMLSRCFSFKDSSHWLFIVFVSAAGFKWFCLHVVRNTFSWCFMEEEEGEENHHHVAERIYLGQISDAVRTQCLLFTPQTRV